MADPYAIGSSGAKAHAGAQTRGVWACLGFLFGWSVVVTTSQVGGIHAGSLRWVVTQTAMVVSRMDAREFEPCR